MPVGSTASHKQLTQTITEALREAIHEGFLAPGEWLRQERLAQEYGVSHMPVREAFKQLAAEGLVEHVPYRGVRVVQVSAADVEDLYACRAMVEGRAAFFAARNISDEELAELDRIQAGIRRAVGPEMVGEYRELNRQFHALIIRASRRALLIRSLAGLWGAFPNMMWNNFRETAERFEEDRAFADEAEHDEIIAALRAHDDSRAEAAMRHHIDESHRALIASLGETR